MPWQPNKPLAGDLLSQSQADLQGNFQALNGVLDPTNPTVKFGQIAPAPAPIANTWQLYTVDVGGTPQLTTQDPLGNEYSFTDGGFANPGWAMLPSGLILIWGRQNTVNALNTAYTFNVPANRSFPNDCLSMQISLETIANGNTDDNIFAVSAFDLNGFTIHRTPGNFGTQCWFRYLAIGY